MTLPRALMGPLNHSILFFFTWLAILPFELLWPVRQVPLRKRWFHFLYVLVTVPIVVIAIQWVAGPHSPELSGDTELPAFIPIVDLSWAFSRLPYPQAFVRLLMIIAGDFFFYWWHRAEHQISVLWPIHKLHHLDRNLNALSTSLVHVIEMPTTSFAFTIAAPWIYQCAGRPPLRGDTLLEELLLFLMFQKLYFWISHSNWKLPYGPFTRVIVGPQMHHIHHSVEARHQNKNFASVLPLWDILFGTYHHPEREWPPEVGIPGEEPPRGQLEALLVPFRGWLGIWKRRQRQALSPETPRS